MAELFRQNHGGGDNWTSQSTAASLIDPSDASGANGAEFFLVTKSAAPIHAVANLE
jgi:hypothetical protein